MQKVHTTGKESSYSAEGPRISLISGNPTYRIYVSTLAQTMGYCELKVPMYADGVREEETEAMREGIRLHKERENAEDQKLFTQISPEEIQQLLKLGEQFEFKMEGEKAILSHNNFEYVGRMDKIPNLSMRTFTVEEFKTQTVRDKARVYDGYIIQAMTYAIMIAKKYEVPVTNGKILFVIKDRKTGEAYTIGPEVITKQHLAQYYHTLNRFEGLYQKKLDPRFHKIEAKCIACNPGFRKVCTIGQQVIK